MRKTHTINSPIFLFPYNFSRVKNIIPRVFRARVYTYMFVYNGANHETHGDHISRHGETQNQKAISVAFVRCQFIAACCPWQVKRKTSSGKRYSVSNALMDFFGDHLVNLCPFLHRGKSRRRRIKRSNDPSAIHLRNYSDLNIELWLIGQYALGWLSKKTQGSRTQDAKHEPANFSRFQGPDLPVNKIKSIARVPWRDENYSTLIGARLSSRRNAPMARWKKVGRGKEIHSKKFW